MNKTYAVYILTNYNEITIYEGYHYQKLTSPPKKTSSKKITDEEFDSVNPETHYVVKNGLIGKYNPKFNNITIPVKYDNIEEFKIDGLTALTFYKLYKNGKIGIAVHNDCYDDYYSEDYNKNQYKPATVILQPKYNKIDFTKNGNKINFNLKLGNKLIIKSYLISETDIRTRFKQYVLYNKR